MARLQAQLKPEHKSQYPGLRGETWYDVAPLFPGVTIRSVNLAGERLTRLFTGRDHVTVKAEHLDFRERPGELDAVAESA
jgi:hypothetical protein